MNETINEALTAAKLRTLTVYITEEGGLGVHSVGLNTLEEIAFAEFLKSYIDMKNTKRIVAQLLMPKPSIITPVGLQ